MIYGEGLLSIYVIHNFSDDISLHLHVTPRGTNTINYWTYCIVRLRSHQQVSSGKYSLVNFTFMREFIALVWVAEHAISSKQTSVGFACSVVVTRRIITSWPGWHGVQSRNKCIKIYKIWCSVPVSQRRYSVMLKKCQQTWQSVGKAGQLSIEDLEWTVWILGSPSKVPCLNNGQIIVLQNKAFLVLTFLNCGSDSVWF